MSTLITAGVLLVAGLWGVAIYGRLVRLRREVTRRWRDLHLLRKRLQALAPADGAPAPDAEVRGEAARATQHAERIYNLVATRYNAAIAGFPGNLFATLAGFKRAELIESTPPTS